MVQFVTLDGLEVYLEMSDMSGYVPYIDRPIDLPSPLPFKTYKTAPPVGTEIRRYQYAGRTTRPEYAFKIPVYREKETEKT